jgi:small subunit ribosomal protein S8
MKDILSDTLTRLRNSSRVKKTKVILLSTNSTKSITSILKREGYIDEVIEIKRGPGLRAAGAGQTNQEPVASWFASCEANQQANQGEAGKHFLHITLKYEGKKMRPSFSNLKSISTPGVRKYAKSNAIPQVLGGLGVIVLSTSQGLMTDTEARKLNIGGELLFAIW